MDNLFSFIYKISYKIVKVISFVLRYLLCYFTIKKIPIFESETVQWFWSALFGGVIYSILLAVCYPLAGFISKKFCIESSSAKSILYFILYLPLVLITYLVLLCFTRFGMLPIRAEITFNLTVWITEKAQSICQWFVDIFISYIDRVVSKLSPT